MWNNETGSGVMWKGRSIIEKNNIKETIALGDGEKQLHSMVEREEGKAEPCTVVQFQWQGEVSAW